MSLAGFLNFGQSVADPLHLTGWKELPGEGSTVSNPGGTAVAMDPAEENRLRAQEYAAWQAQQATNHQNAQDQSKGFMANMGWRPQEGMFGKTPGAMPAAPPSGWSYQPGQGATWMTPQHTIQAGPDKQSQNWSYAPAASGSPFAGNRI